MEWCVLALRMVQELHEHSQLAAVTVTLSGGFALLFLPWPWLLHFQLPGPWCGTQDHSSQLDI